MMRIVLLASFIASALLSVTAQAKSGDGALPISPGQAHPLVAVGAKPLAESKRDALRVSAAPSLGGRAVVFEITRSDSKWAAGGIYFLVGHPAIGWEKVGYMPIRIATAEFDELLADAQRMRREQAAAETLAAEQDEILVCADGPQYDAEFWSKDQSGWVTSGCSDPTGTIAAIGAIVQRSAKQFTYLLDRTGEAGDTAERHKK